MSNQERQPYSNIHRIKKRCNALDMQEILKQEIYKQGYDNDSSSKFGTTTNNSGQVMQALVPKESVIGFEDYELYFDSVYRDMSSDYTIGEIKWQIAVLNNNQSLSNCIEMHIGSFFFPKIYSDIGRPEFLYFRRVYLEFQGAPSTQGVLGPNGARFHFEFDVENLTGQSIKLTPVKSSFFFQRPITTLTDFQIRFMVPPTDLSSSIMKKIPIPHENVSVISLLNAGIGYNPIRFQIVGADNTNVLGLIGSLGVPGVAVFISGYNSNDNTTNISINNQSGIFVTTIINSSTFEIAGIDASSVTAQYPATMYIPKNRIAFPLRFSTIRDQQTNYININHS